GAIIDPQAIVIGGGLTKSELFNSMMQKEINQHMPHIYFLASTQSVSATLDGAVIIARDLALSRTLGTEHTQLVPHPSLWSESGEQTLKWYTPCTHPLPE